MDKKYLNDEFDHFFDCTTEDKSQVSSVSAKLFAEHIAYPVLMDNARLKDQLAAQAATIEKLRSALNTHILAYE